MFAAQDCSDKHDCDVSTHARFVLAHEVADERLVETVVVVEELGDVVGGRPEQTLLLQVRQSALRLLVEPAAGGQTTEGARERRQTTNE